MTRMNDHRGVSTTTDGEQYEKYRDYRGNILVQYDFRDKDGQLFTCTKSTIGQCRDARDRWLSEKEAS